MEVGRSTSRGKLYSVEGLTGEYSRRSPNYDGDNSVIGKIVFSQQTPVTSPMTTVTKMVTVVVRGVVARPLSMHKSAIDRQRPPQKLEAIRAHCGAFCAKDLRGTFSQEVDEAVTGLENTLNMVTLLGKHIDTTYRRA